MIARQLSAPRYKLQSLHLHTWVAYRAATPLLQVGMCMPISLMTAVMLSVAYRHNEGRWLPAHRQAMALTIIGVSRLSPCKARGIND